MSEKKPWGAPISATDAMKKINAYQEKYPGQTKSSSFPAECIIRWAEQLKANPELVKGVFYYGLDENGMTCLIYYPATDKGNLRSVELGEDNVSFEEDGGATGDNFSSQCPPDCVDCPPNDPNCNL